MFEVTRSGLVVWEWISPFTTRQIGMEQQLAVPRLALPPSPTPDLSQRDLDPARHAALNRQFGLAE